MLVRIKNYTVSDIEDSIKFLLDRAAQSPEVRQHAIQITHDKQDKISAVYDWIKQSISYIPDPMGAEGEEIELFISPVRLVKDYNLGLKSGGDCDDHAILATSLYRAIGIRSNVVIIDSAGNGLDHAFSEVWSDKIQDWISVDTTSTYPIGWSFPYKDKIVVN